MKIIDKFDKFICNRETMVTILTRTRSASKKVFMEMKSKRESSYLWATHIHTRKIAHFQSVLKNFYIISFVIGRSEKNAEKSTVEATTKVHESLFYNTQNLVNIFSVFKWDIFYYESARIRYVEQTVQTTNTKKRTAD